MLQYYDHHILRGVSSDFGHNIITLLTPLAVGFLVRFMVLTRYTHFDFEDGGSMYFQDVSNTAHIHSV
jgi:hypothetical protein